MKLAITFLILCSSAFAQWTNLMPSCTPDAVSFQESFGDGGALCWASGVSKCSNTWVIGGGTAHSIAATPGSPPLYTACTNSLKMTEVAATAGYIYTPLGTVIASGATADITFTLDITANAQAAFDLTSLVAPVNDQNGATGPGIMYIKCTVSTPPCTTTQLEVVGSTTSAVQTITTSVWHKILIHFQSGAAASYFSVDGGTHNTFTENAQKVAYIGVGENGSSNLDGMTYYIGNMFVNATTAPACAWPQALVDWRGSTNTTVMTPVLAAASTWGGNGTWTGNTSPLTGLTFATVAQKNLVTTSDICGTYHTGSDSTLGMQWDISVAGQKDIDFTPITNPAVNTYTMGLWWQTNLAATDANFYTVAFIGDVGGVDYAGPEENGDTTQLLLHMETSAGNVGSVLTAAGTASGGSTVYTGTITGGGSNAYSGHKFQIGGFATGANNGTFAATASTTTTLTLSNASGVAETHAGTATDSVQVSPSTWYWIETQYVAGGTSTMKVYDSSCSLLGTIFHAGTNAALPNIYRIGRVGSETGNPAGKTFWYGPAKFDYITGKFPLGC